MPVFTDTRGAYDDLGLLKRYGPEPFYALWLPIVAFFAYVGVRIGRQRAKIAAAPLPEKLLDTSVIIDGRIVEIVASGFVDGALVERGVARRRRRLPPRRVL